MKLDDLIKDLSAKRAAYGNLDVYVKERYVGGYDLREPWPRVDADPKVHKQIVRFE